MASTETPSSFKGNSSEISCMSVERRSQKFYSAHEQQLEEILSGSFRVYLNNISQNMFHSDIMKIHSKILKRNVEVI